MMEVENRRQDGQIQGTRGCLGIEGSHNACDVQHLKAEKLLSALLSGKVFLSLKS